MANQKKTNSNNKKNNTKKVDTTKKVNASKNTNNTKKVEKTNDKNLKEKNKKVNEKEVTKVQENLVEKETTKVKKERKSFELTSAQKDFVLVVLVAILLVIALVLTGNKNPKLNIELPVELQGTAGFNEITYTEYEEKLNTEAPFVVVIVKDGCGYCDQYKPVVDTVAKKYNIPVSYINLSNLTSEEQSSLAKSNTYLKKEQWGTPTTLFMYGNVVVDSIGGYVDETTFTDFAKENFVVTENE